MHADIICQLAALSWPAAKAKIAHNGFASNPLLSASIPLRHLNTVSRWMDMETLYGKHAPQLSEIFIVALHHFVNAQSHVIESIMDRNFMASNDLDFPALSTKMTGIYITALALLTAPSLGSRG